jgi:membrane-bound lytic murein transglycosylase D
LYPTLNPSSYDIVLRDADQRINPEFHVPAELEKPFHFWLDIYTKYTTQQMVFFDRVNPDVVYEILDFRELSQKHPNRIIYELTMKHWITKKIKAYKAAFASLSKKHQKRHKMTEEEKNILSALERSKHQHLKVAALAKTFHSQLGQRDNMVKGLLAAESYFPMMEQLFMSEGIPPELTRLSMVESSFDLSAYSRVGAVGIWQFMPGPGHKLLTIDDQAGIDERVSPLKSTVAAGRLLHFNYKLFHNWALAITSYNHGLRGLSKFRKKSSRNDMRSLAYLFDPASKKSPLGFASKNYYLEFLAVLHAEAYHHLFYGEPPSRELKPLVYKRLETSETAYAVAMEHGIPIQEMRVANPDIRSFTRRLPKGFLIAVPGVTEDLAELTQSNPLATKPRRSRTHKV